MNWVYIRDLDGQYHLVNRESEKHLAIQPGEWIGKTPYDFFAKELADEFIADGRTLLPFRRLLIVARA